MAISKKNYLLSTVSVDVGCSSCRRPSLSAVFAAKPKYSLHRKRRSSFSSSSISTSIDTPPASYSSDTDSDIKSLQAVKSLGRLPGDSVAVEKDSDDPYLDFRRSMLQMILEKEIYAKDDLRELLNCFLQLNSPYYHGVIVRAFTEIWNGVYSVRCGGDEGGDGGAEWKSRDF